MIHTIAGVTQGLIEALRRSSFVGSRVCKLTQTPCQLLPYTSMNTIVGYDVRHRNRSIHVFLFHLLLSASVILRVIHVPPASRRRLHQTITAAPSRNALAGAIEALITLLETNAKRFGKDRDLRRKDTRRTRSGRYPRGCWQSGWRRLGPL